jgi:hypothetical protein
MGLMKFDSFHVQRSMAIACLALVAAGAARPCGFENPDSVAGQRGVMNLAFPKSAWVSTAVWQAQKAGDLPLDALPRRDDLTPQARASLQLMRATWLLKNLAKRLDVAPGAANRPAIAVVLMGPMLWSRVEPRDGAVAARAQIHVGGPEPGDVVLVTDTPAIEAIVGAGMRFERAQQLGLVRLYGSAAQVDAAQAWLGSSH